AEAPDNNFAPSVGTLTTLRLPDHIARIDSGVEEGQEITPYYDPMISKVITHAGTREEALGRMRQALSETYVAGLETNAAFLYKLAAQPEFIAGDVSTRFIDDHNDDLFHRAPADHAVWATAALWRKGQAEIRDDSPWASLRGFRLNRPRKEVIWLEDDGEAALLTLEEQVHGFAASLERKSAAALRREGQLPEAPISFSFSGEIAPSGEVRLEIDGRKLTTFVASHLEGLRIWIGASAYDVRSPDPLAGSSGQSQAEGSLTAPMPGVVTVLSAAPGDSVKAGDPLLVMEAMKMEHTIKAPQDGVVVAYKFAAGDQVKDGDLLVDFEQAE
ncbi:MAG: biotin/lipoyl-containing protein, partial [Pseudomonadota bacterium]